ncbi:hypothetical protein P5P86_01525 [Nocardioides sp. BP30]|uniref:hypothetical protein n=1 Tax=Nocardioides sp. BP30 TaxID=3036374 RepID=UPI002468CA31|nr:hypothetical protein [Nocardioides sp. BP30]WGL52519.1 hypothetical protein P5P86_01525 [Nocardioides sp. BP30]
MTLEGMIGIILFSCGALIFGFRSVKWYLISTACADSGERDTRIGFIVSSALAGVVAIFFVAVMFPMIPKMWLAIVFPVAILAEGLNSNYWGKRMKA